MEKFGKSIGPLLEHKCHFWENNDSLLSKRKQIADFYASQPKRESCKICDSDIDSSNPSFTKMDVGYVLCGQCGQLNGVYKDTDEFVTYLYTDSEGDEQDDDEIDYGEEYREDDRERYDSRLENIYIPKAEFVFEALQEEGETPAELQYADLGAGSGYMIAALEELGADTVSGFEVSANQVEFAQQMNEGMDINLIESPEIYEIAATTDAEVVTMIGVLEHLQQPTKVMETLSQNPDVEYVFLLVPMFSPSVLFEMSFPSVMPRHLVAGHTHLFRESSIDWLCEELGFERRSEWWFGEDMIDLVRAVEVTIQETADDEIMDLCNEMIRDAVDELQLVLDEKKLSSSIHVLLEST